ncbi:MAG TPA: ATP-binding protein [Terracidiphilus sp.]
MISIERVRELIQLGNENRNVDYKGAFSWKQASTDEKCEIVKDVLAFSNTRDGGVILVGVDDKSGAIEGLTQEQWASFDQTTFNDFVRRYTDPGHPSNIHRIQFDGKLLVVIDIPEFADVPILCARDANSSVNSSRLILRKGAVYKRTERATSEVVEDGDSMRELLNRGLLRRQDDLLRAVKQIIQPSETATAPDPGTEFIAEIQDAQRYLSELDAGRFGEAPHWTVQMRPERHRGDLIPNAARLQRLVEESAISLRGWTFPIAGKVSGATWSNFNGGSQSFHSGGVHSPEALRVYKSGLIVWRSGIWEDWWGEPFAANAISFIALIFAATEWLLFARRFFETLLSGEESVHLTVRAWGIKERKLVSADPIVQLPGEFRIEVGTFVIEETVAVSALRADPEAIARKVIREIFELFNWNDPNEQMLTKWQQQLLQRKF